LRYATAVEALVACLVQAEKHILLRHKGIPPSAALWSYVLQYCCCHAPAMQPDAEKLMKDCENHVEVAMPVKSTLSCTWLVLKIDWH